MSWVKNGQLVRQSSATGVPAGGEGGKRASSWYIIDQRPISASEKYKARQARKKGATSSDEEGQPVRV